MLTEVKLSSKTGYWAFEHYREEQQSWSEIMTRETKEELLEIASTPLKDENGEDIIGSLDTGFKVSGTIQGEGKLIGTPCLFIRTSGCNLRCSWVGSDGNGSPCDTPYSSHNPEKNMMEIDSIIKILNANRGNIS